MSRTPIPGRPVRGSHTGVPIMAALDLLGRRWALRILWELRQGPLTSRALRTACGGTSPTVIHDRTRELREAGLVALDEPAGYTLTPLGRDLGKRLAPLQAWSERWAESIKPLAATARRTKTHPATMK